ncbi:unnamed protein product [Schistocephalus solidus]|uniref:TraL protein n=1 Tax=Schistocephalus solidus TaxID=70667 RepID=A0A183TMP7_SCHSO|nr:unnamed protein product [Schistocephalus solidus]
MTIIASAALFLLAGCTAAAVDIIQLNKTQETSTTGPILQNTSSEAAAANGKLTERVVYLLDKQKSAGQTPSLSSAVQSPCDAWMALLDPGKRGRDCRVVGTAVNRLMRYIRRELESSRMYWWLRSHQIEPKDFLNFIIGQVYQAVNMPVNGTDPSWMVNQPPSSTPTDSPTPSIHKIINSSPLLMSSVQPNAEATAQASSVQFSAESNGAPL